MEGQHLWHSICSSSIYSSYYRKIQRYCFAKTYSFPWLLLNHLLSALLNLCFMSGQSVADVFGLPFSSFLVTKQDLWGKKLRPHQNCSFVLKSDGLIPFFQDSKILN